MSGITQRNRPSWQYHALVRMRPHGAAHLYRTVTTGEAMSAGQDEGWFAEFDREASAGVPWRPVLQLDGGHAPDLDIWFASQQECEDWIRDNVIGRGMLDA